MRMSSLLIFFSVIVLAPGLMAAEEIGVKSTSDFPPRKVIVGTAMQAFWGVYPGLDKFGATVRAD